MAESVRLVSPDEIERNPENPRLIFRQDELQELQDSIANQGILVPLTVYQSSSSKALVILDGERRWRCARRLGLAKLPVIVQQEPSPIQNIMMMFAIHNSRREWEPLPTAFKLQQLEDLYTEVEGRRPNEAELAQLASIKRGEVRRLKNLLKLPQQYIDELMVEAEKPRSEQRLTVDHVLETTKGAYALRKRGVVTAQSEERLRSAIVNKFKTGKLNSTVEPRKLADMARAVERGEVGTEDARAAVKRLISDPDYTVDQAHKDVVGRAGYEHTLEQQIERLVSKLEQDSAEGNHYGDHVYAALRRLRAAIRAALPG
jgi:ParB/RepB/Spo0J family partition protein